MFEIKYDRDGTPVREKQRIDEFAKQAEAVVPPVAEQHFPDSAEDDNAVLAQENGDSEPDGFQESVTEPSPDETPAQSPQPEPESDAKKSFRELSAAKRKAERERDEYLRRLEEMETRAHRQQATTPKEQAEEDEEFHLGADDIAEGKHIAKVDNRAQKKIRALEERLSKYETKTNEERAEAALRSKFPDFDKVVSMDNVALLSEAYPELARTIQSNNDLYTKAVSAYTMIKKFGIYQESPFTSEKALAMKNVAKPRPLTSVSPQQGDSPLGRANAFANGLTDDLKTQLLKEMQASRKSY